MCLNTSARIIPVQFLRLQIHPERWIVPSIHKHPKLGLILIMFRIYLPLKLNLKIDKQTRSRGYTLNITGSIIFFELITRPDSFFCSIKFRLIRGRTADHFRLQNLLPERTSLRNIGCMVSVTSERSMYNFFCKVEKAVHFPSARIAFLWLKCRCQMGRSIFNRTLKQSCISQKGI